jgi:hypothetical protein
MQLDPNRDAKGNFKVSQSKVRQYRDCKAKWWYAHVLKIEPKRKPRPLSFGTISHKMKERLARGDDPLKYLDLIPREDLETYRDNPEIYGDIIEDLRHIYASYMDFWEGRELIYLEHDNRRAEFPFEVEIKKDNLLIKGTIDAVTRHRNMNWLTEHKNHARIPNDDERWRSVQSVVYIRILQMLGWWKNIEGTCWDYIRTHPPSRPQLLKDGSISRRKIDSLPIVIEETLAQHKKQPGYKSLIDAAISNMPTYFVRVYTPIKTKVVDKLWSDFLATAREMSDVDYRTTPVRTIARHCSYCQYAPICRAAIEGGDEDFVIEHDYVPSTYGDEHEESSETA